MDLLYAPDMLHSILVIELLQHYTLALINTYKVLNQNEVFCSCNFMLLDLVPPQV